MAVSRTVIPMCTGIPLSERFQQTRATVEVAESPFRMNFGVNSSSNRSVTRGFGLNLDDDLTAPAPSAPRTLRRPTQNRLQGFGSGLANGTQNNANLLAIKEAEIRRLRAQLRVTKAHLIIAMSQEHGGLKQDLQVLRTSAFKGGAGLITKRAGGGIRFGNRGRRLNLISNKKASALFTRSRPGTSPMNRKAAGTGTKSVGLNFFGEPRSKEDLDEELEAYMSKSKGKVKNDLDKELDDYMKVARQQSFAAKIGLTTSAAVPTPPALADIDGDAAMEEA